MDGGDKTILAAHTADPFYTCKEIMSIELFLFVYVEISTYQLQTARQVYIFTVMIYSLLLDPTW